MDAGVTRPARPLLIYDGRCAFCLLWIDRWKRKAGGVVDFAPASEAASRFPSIPPETYQRSVVLVDPDGTHHTGARAAIGALKHTTAGSRLLRLYDRLPGFRGAIEGGYNFVAGHRDEMYLLTRVLWGRSTVPPGFASSQWLFLRALALIYAAAFISVMVQFPGLFGSNGISPAAMFLDAVHSQIGNAGMLYYPTLAWINPGDWFLTGLCVAGLASSLLLFVGILPKPAAAAAWCAYFSLVTAGQVFFQFQWDSLLLEAGFLAMVLAPWGWARMRPDPSRDARATRWLYWLLLFRLMFMSGVVKLTAGDVNWWNLSALTFHFQTQPLPTPLAWYAHKLPDWFQRVSVFLMFCVEIGSPLLIVTPRRTRHLGAAMLAGFQVLIALTGNFAFFNVLTLALCLLLLDDGVVSRFVPAFLRPRGSADPAPARPHRAGVPVTAAFVVMLILNFNQLAGLFIPRSWWPSTVATATAWASHFRIVNGYGLFRVMTTKRPELIIEGSDDRTEWKAYGFRYKPGDPAGPLRWVAPHQPRLDWQLWFAALGSPADNTWVTNLAIRILEGSPETLALLGDDPFGGKAPRYVRALLYEYRFTTPAERDSTGAPWVRSLNSLYLAPISLDGN